MDLRNARLGGWCRSPRIVASSVPGCKRRGDRCSGSVCSPPAWPCAAEGGGGFRPRSLADLVERSEIVPADLGLGDKPGADLAKVSTLHPPQLDSRHPMWTEPMFLDRIGATSLLPSFSRHPSHPSTFTGRGETHDLARVPIGVSKCPHARQSAISWSEEKSEYLCMSLISMLASILCRSKPCNSSDLLPSRTG